MDDTSAVKILIVEDEESIRSLVKSYLEREGYSVSVATTGLEGLDLARKLKPELIILDLMLPGMEGLEVCKVLRSESEVYILILTARTDEVDRIVGLTVGADDYLTKPFSPRELVARVKARLRRQRTETPGQNPPQPTRQQWNNLALEPEARRVWVNDRLLELTKIEFDLLQTLAEMPGRVFSRDKLLELVWGHDFFGDDRVVDVHIGQLRRKIENAGGGQPIKTVWGVGYRFEPGKTESGRSAEAKLEGRNQ